ncbi:MAG TPA: sialate O-acetylesterase [Bacteroidota bacterium]|nr:sialate O-acetylesterase [Bacteroidota bacterium]
MKFLSMFFLLAFVVLVSPVFAGPAPNRLASVFSDNMVLQQQRAVPVWGNGSPGAAVSVQASWGKSASGTVGVDSAWQVRLQTPRAGGPFTLEIHVGDSLFTLKNVMVGEVWLCSGQSNMEMPLQGWPPNAVIDSSAREIREATYGDIRLLTVPRAASLLPLSTFNARWVECSPATASGFSATAYFFGRALYKKLHVPIGLVHSSWGGTPAEAWTGLDTLARFPEYDTVLSKMTAARESLGVFARWLSQYPMIDMRGTVAPDRWAGLKFRDDSCALAAYPDSLWPTMQLPRLWETTDMGNFDGVVWFRRTIEMPKSWEGRELVLELGPIDDMDITYVNGTRVGGYESEGYYAMNRVYTIPTTSVRDSLLHIAVRVLDYQGGGGIWGNGQRMRVHPAGSDSSIALEGTWRYWPVADLVSGVFYIFGPSGRGYFSRPYLPIDVSSFTPASLYQGMILPLVPFSLAGTIWYQGESNVSNPGLYARLFPAMIRNWRDVFHLADMPFDFVQIAPFAYGGASHSELLREAQFKTLSLKNTGMAVTLDIGNTKNIHPGDKQDVGSRLALWALSKTYGKNIECSGPIPVKVTRTKKFVEIRFDHAKHGLVLRDTASGSGFVIAGADSVFHPASVRLVNDRIQVSSPNVHHPLAVRYAFTDTSMGTLFNKEGLPAPSFRTDGWVVK